ncbi:MAG TPA: DUF1214 domain-containing protein, partial [Burkholderiaceae bacterium]|nr:DUF1214 domain-containing protein [Burkholderiaceae bacterium]
NERLFPQHASGQFAICLKGSTVEVPAGVQRVDVPVKCMRVLSRVELGANWDEAVALQHQFEIRASGQPALPQVPKTLTFDMGALPGVEAFDSAELALDSEADINPGMSVLQASVRAIAKAAKEPGERQRIDQAVRTKALADIKKAMPNIGHGKVSNGWALPPTSGVYGDDWLVRTLVNYGGIWANTPEEVIYYKAFANQTGEPLSGERAYTMHFTKDQLPAQYATHFWSVIAVDSVNRRVLPNPLKRYLLNKESKLQYGADGSLTLHFSDAQPMGAPQGNWLPTPKGTGYSLTFRFYRPQGAVAKRSFFPPPLVAQ